MHIERKIRRQVKHYRKLVKSDAFGKRYGLFCLVVLFGTTLFWTILSASLQHGNADQIVNSYLFKDWQTLSSATLPGVHTFLIKWPLFYLIHMIGISGFTLGLFTVLVALATVGGLVFLLRKIEPRPLYFGTICLALASVLLLVPAQPYAGGILPVNMAMLATRNIEYVLFMGSLLLLIKSPGFKTRAFWLATVLLALLFASDKLFLTLSLGGALLVLLVFSFASQIELFRLARTWLVSSLAAWVGTAGLLWLVGHSLTHISSYAGSPYSIVHDVHNIGLGIIYSLTGLLTNFGANPAFDATVLRNIPGQLHSRLTDIGGVSYLINFCLLIFGAFIAWRLVHARLASAPKNRTIAARKDKFTKLSLMLIASTIAAMIVFVLTRHAWAVDARYLSVGVFALFVTTASFISQKKALPQLLVFIGGFIFLGIILGISQSAKVYNADKSALAFINQRNASVVAAINHHKVDILVGDYWRVLPIKLASDNQLKVMPLDNCTHPRVELSTKAWQPDLNNRKFAYLLTLDRGLTDYPTCTLDQVIAAYGRPNTSSLIAGQISNPKELLLFYDNGIGKSSPTRNLPQSPASTVLPISLNQLPNVNCPDQTIMNTVAHQDDDLLFMTPDLLHDLHDGNCVRTLYFTAGDAGGNQFYWLNREQGSEAAYSKMIGYDGIWVKRIVRLGDNQYIRVDNPRGNFKISLIFMRLPDGNAKGQGFRTTNYESLEKLGTGKIGLIHSVDNQSVYSYSQLQDAVLSLVRTYQPAEIRTQSTFVDRRYPDHSDHIAVSRLTHRVWAQYDSRLSIKYYLGYQSYGRPQNVFGSDLQQTEDAFFAYAKYDPSVCGSEISCQKSKASYGAYLHTQYTNLE